MTEQRWQQIRALFDAALELPAEARQSFLDRETGENRELHAQVEEMLRHASLAPDRIACTIGSVAQKAVGGYAWIGRRVGPYRLVREIGRGGMGIVFEARRDDAEYHKTVALKIAPEWRDLERLRERFRNERQILAGLEHPNIARFLDGGTDSGVPYFVMEYVEGSPITAWCAEHQLGLRERISLFRQVCSAVHSAHESLVVHRDLKPANILVGADGSPKLLDFGIAKLLSPFPEDETATTGARLWTPDYTSPEQLRGGSVTTRTDVYSLGLILYELLTGERAQKADPSSPLALDRSICETEPPLMSARAAQHGDRVLSKQLRGDLDTIASMAIRKEPEMRYGSAAALSADLGRWLDGKPVEACPATPAYRVGKWLGRHRLAFGAASLLLASIVAGGISTVYQARRAERRFNQVRTLANTFVFDIHDSIQQLPGATEARKKIVTTALRYLENLRQDAGGDPALLLELAAAYEKVGDVQGEPVRSNLNDTKGALASYHSAETILDPLYARGDVRARLPMASIHYKLGMLQKAFGQRDAALAEYAQARDIVRQLLDQQPRDAASLGLASDIHAELARFYLDLNKPQQARQAAEETSAIGQRLVALNPASVESRVSLSAAQSSLGSAYTAADEPERAAQSFRSAIGIREQLVKEHPEVVDYQRNLMISYGHISRVLGNPREGGLGDLSGAIEALKKAIAIAEWLCRRDPSDRKARFDLASAQHRAGNLLLRAEHAGEAQSLLGSAAALLHGLEREDPSNQNYRFNSLYVDRKLGEALAALHRDAEAEREFASVRARAESFRDTRYRVAAQGAAILATLSLSQLKARVGGAGVLSLADSVAKGLAQPEIQSELHFDWIKAELYADLATVYKKLGRNDSAALWLEKSAQLWREMKVPTSLEAQRRIQLAAVEDALAKLRPQRSSNTTPSRSPSRP